LQEELEEGAARWGGSGEFADGGVEVEPGGLAARERGLCRSALVGREVQARERALDDVDFSARHDAVRFAQRAHHRERGFDELFADAAEPAAECEEADCAASEPANEEPGDAREPGPQQGTHDDDDQKDHVVREC